VPRYVVTIRFGTGSLTFVLEHVPGKHEYERFTRNHACPSKLWLNADALYHET
jgi:hypothetical protein